MLDSIFKSCSQFILHKQGIYNFCWEKQLDWESYIQNGEERQHDGESG